VCYPLAKRAFDIAFALLGLIVFLPVAAVVAALIKLGDGGPVFYGQTRVGRLGRPFRIRKFRTMVCDADQRGAAVTHGEDKRITQVGRLLRKTKLDELPQLWNVLVGEMSFVGPRPEVPRYVEQYTPEQREILQYKPGITDMATLLFRNEETLLRGATDVEEFYLRYCVPRKIELNREYARRASLLQDIWIILQTLCPYWLGLIALYGLVLVASLGLAFSLRFDFQMTSRERVEFVRALPWMVLPQMILLFWRGQFRGLLSYFSLLELRQTVTALGLACLLQLGLWHLLGGRFLPGRSIVFIHFLLSLTILCGARLYFRLLREQYARPKPATVTRPWRVGIIGPTETSTRLALELNQNSNGERNVVALFDDNPRTWHRRLHDLPVVGMPECLLNGEWLSQIDEIIIALPDDNPQRLAEVRQMLRGLPFRVTLASTGSVLRPLPA
jgi:lipopolysaccharide/colanic/teichoic acid biosynthesis glycosyltransferase